MRHPPSAGCLFGQTGCLTAQAVDGILMHMTNDSLSLSPDFFLLGSLSHSSFSLPLHVNEKFQKCMIQLQLMGQL